MVNEKICPKCGKGQIVCTYLGELEPKHHFWRHDCANPSCGMSQRFDAREKSVPGYPANELCLPNDVFAYNAGPGKYGGCPGHE